MYPWALVRRFEPCEINRDAPRHAGLYGLPACDILHEGESPASAAHSALVARGMQATRSGGRHQEEADHGE